MNEKKDLEFVLFHPVSICISDERFKYGIKDGMYYPCLLGFISEDNKLVEVISGREFNIISEEDYRRGYVKITNSSKVVADPVYVCRRIDNSLENLHLIEKYIDTKGNLSQRIISQYCDFNYRLNHLLFNQRLEIFSTKVNQGFYDSFIRFKTAKHYLKEIDIENSTSLAEFAYIQSGLKERDDFNDKTAIISRLTKKLTLPRNTTKE